MLSDTPTSNYSFAYLSNNVNSILSSGLWSLKHCYAQAQAQVKKFYEEAKPYYEKARQLKPDQKDLWAPGLYRVYYNLNMGPEFEEIEKLQN